MQPALLLISTQAWVNTLGVAYSTISWEGPVRYSVKSYGAPDMLASLSDKKRLSIYPLQLSYCNEYVYDCLSNKLLTNIAQCRSICIQGKHFRSWDKYTFQKVHEESKQMPGPPIHEHFQMLNLHASRRWFYACPSIFTRSVFIHAAESCRKRRNQLVRVTEINSGHSWQITWGHPV